MRDDRVIFGKSFFDKFILFVKSPITALFFSVVTGIYFYYLGKDVKAPCFYYTNPTLVAEKSNKDLKIYFKEHEVENVYYTDLIIWNEGDEYIDYNDFIESKPIKFYSPDSVRLLSVNINKKSRSDLNFIFAIKDNSLLIRLAKDEAFEKNDGVCFHVLYTSHKKGEKFNLISRIKGNLDGFVFKDLSNFKRSNYEMSIYFLWILIFFLLSVRIITLLIYRKEIIFREKELIFISLLLIFTIYATVDYIFFTTNLNWL